VTKLADSHSGAAEARDARTAEQVLIASTPLDGRELPAKVVIAPWGRVRSGNGTFVIDEDAARAALEAFRAHGTDLPIDYEHQSLGGAYASPSGQAPAAGWIRNLQAVPPTQADGGQAGLLADVEWTEAARARLAAREYRYLSPVVIVRTSDRRVVAVHSVALTNKPAIVGMKPIVNRQVANGGEPSAELAADDAPAEPNANMGQDTSTEATALADLRARLDVEEDAEEITVLRSAVDRIDALSEELARQRAAEKVASAMRAGTLTGAQREWAMALAMKDPAAFDAWAASAPPVVATGRTNPPSERGEPGGATRTTIIAQARRTYKQQDRTNRATCSLRAWVNDSLRERGLERLSNEEMRTLGMADSF